MRVLVAGALGDLGIKVCELLRDGGEEVWGLTRTRERAAQLRGHGIHPAVGDLLDAASTRSALGDVGPDAVISVPIALPQRGPIRPGDLRATNRLRVEGTRHLLEAAVMNGVRRFVSESIVAIYGYGDVARGLLDEASATERQAPFRSLQPAVDALHKQEAMVLGAARRGEIEGVIVRLGFYYGADVGSTRFMAKLLSRRAMPVSRKRGAMPWIEVNDAASGVVAALHHGRSGEIYNIVSDESIGLSDLAHEIAQQLGASPPRELPMWVIRLGGRYAALMGETRLYVSNAKAKKELGWEPRFPSVELGMAHAASDLRAGKT